MIGKVLAQSQSHVASNEMSAPPDDEEQRDILNLTSDSDTASSSDDLGSIIGNSSSVGELSDGKGSRS